MRLLLEGEALRLARTHMTPQIRAELEAILAKMEAWDGNLLESAALDLQFHRILWKACANPYLERALNSLMVTLFAHKTLEHVTHDVRRWRLSHHRILLDAVMGRLGRRPAGRAGDPYPHGPYRAGALFDPGPETCPKAASPAFDRCFSQLRRRLCAPLSLAKSLPNT